jgi:2-hydroxychromene-2-carboxylate isomerase
MPSSPAPLEFWFDFSSPYAYFAAPQVDDLAARHGREALWRPFMLGAAFRVTGMAPLTEQGPRGDYGLRDWARLGRLHGAPFVMPPGFPLNTLAAARMFYALDAEDPAKAKGFARRVFEQAFGEGLDVSQPEVAAQAGAAAGVDPATLLAAAKDERWKQVLRERTDEAIGRGVFGSPFLIVDGEPFWGADRLPMAELWLERGGW